MSSFKVGDACETVFFGTKDCDGSLPIWASARLGKMAFDSIDAKTPCVILSTNTNGVIEIAVMNGAMRRGWVYTSHLRPV